MPKHPGQRYASTFKTEKNDSPSNRANFNPPHKINCFLHSTQLGAGDSLTIKEFPTFNQGNPDRENPMKLFGLSTKLCIYLGQLRRMSEASQAPKASCSSTALAMTTIGIDAEVRWGRMLQQRHSSKLFRVASFPLKRGRHCCVGKRIELTIEVSAEVGPREPRLYLATLTHLLEAVLDTSDLLAVILVHC